MRRTVWMVALWILANQAGSVLAGEKGTAGSDVFPYPIEKTVLDNGLTVLSVAFDSPGIIAYYTVVRTGARNEVEPGLSGFAHFFEHMMFRGTDRYPAEKYNDVLKSLGADSNAYTNEDWTCYHMTVPASALGTAVELEADRFQNLKYDEAGFQKEARAVLGEYNKGASSPFQKLNEAMQATSYTTHTYKHTTIGFLADVKDMPNQYAYSKVFFDRWYRPENCTVIVAGDVKHDELVRLMKPHYGRWKRGKAEVVIPEEPPQAAGKSAQVSWPLPTLPILYLAYHVPATRSTDPDTAALKILEQAVFGETSKLYQELVLKDQTAVMLFAQAEQKRDPGLFGILVRVRKPSDLAGVRERIKLAIKDAAERPIDPGRLRGIKDHLRYEFAGSLESADSVANVVGGGVAIEGRAGSINDLYAAYDRVTPGDLQRVAAKYFKANNETVVTLETESKK